MECKYEENIEIWKIQRMIKNLADARGNGTSMISLVMPPTEEVSKINHMLTNEFGTASNIKSRVNRLSVLSAIKSINLNCCFLALLVNIETSFTRFLYFGI